MRHLWILPIATLFLLGAPAVAQRPTAAGTADKSRPVERIDLSESSRATADAGRFLQQPKLAEAIAAARADKASSEEAARNPQEFLTKRGVMVPRNMEIKFDPSSGGGTASKVKVEVTIRCCPLNIKITISW